MKIDPNMMIGAVTSKAPAAKTAGQAGVFEDLLRDVQKTGAKEGSPVQAMPQMNLPNPQKVGALTMSQQALDLLDTYSKALLDPGNTLKTLAPVVDELEAMSSKLIDAGSFLSDGDPLKGIMNDVSATLSGEVMRFRRGDLTG